MSLTSKVLAGTLGLASLVGASGCASDGSDAAILGTLIGAAGAKKGNAGAAYAGDRMADYGIAKAGRSNVNVNVNNGNGESNGNYQDRSPPPIRGEWWENSKGRKNVSIACFNCDRKRLEYLDSVDYDLNNDNKIESNEFVNERKVYPASGEMVAVILHENTQGKLELGVFDSMGNEIHRRNVAELNQQGIARNAVIIKMNNVKPDENTFRWYLNGKEFGNSSIKIVNDKR